ncbi:MAG: BACON domain-containing protein, partial [Alistipes sp.]|nr:BACON domain-containing protein [Alistipes sp.]
TMKSIKFEAGKVVGIDNLYTVGGEAGTLTVEFKTNIDLNNCWVIIGDDWLTMADTRAEMRDETLVFSYTANPYGYERWTWIEIYTKSGNFVEHFEIVQEATKEWTVLGEGLFYDDFISWVYTIPAGNCANVTIEESTTRPGYYRMLNPFSKQNVAIFIGGIPADMTFAAEDVYIEIDATDPDAVVIPYQYAGLAIDDFGGIYIASLDSYGTLNNGNISFPMNGLGLFNSESQGFYANTSGLFKVVLPGYVNKTEQLATPILYAEDISDTSFKVMWNVIENAEYYIVDDGVDTHAVYDTNFTLSGLENGSYTVRVKAVAEKNSPYFDSEYASITCVVGTLTPEECDWAECEVSLPTEENAYDNLFPFTHIFHSIRGTGIVEIKCGIFEANDYANTDAASMVGECATLNEYVADANSGGTTLLYNVSPATEYRVVTLITNEEGQRVIFDQRITTTEAQPHPAMEAYVGTWNVSTEQALIIPLSDDSIRVEAQSLSTTATISPATEFGYNAVYITGLIHPEFPAIGYVQYYNGNPTLYIMNGEVVSVSEDGQYYIGLGTICEVNLPDGTTQYGYVGGSYPSFTIQNGKGTAFAGELNVGGTFEVISIAVAEYDNSLTPLGWYFDIEADTVLMAGEQTWTRTSSDIPEDNTEEEAPATFSKGLNIRKVTAVNMPSYVAL